MKAMDAFDYDNREFLFMNKDEVLLSFTVVGEGELETIEVKEVYSVLAPWVSSPAAYIAKRRAPKNRENIEKLLKDSGCDSLLGYLRITHALSLNDTFWVKEKDSPLAWKQVSLYTNNFNEVIAKTAFDGGLYGIDLATTSPEYGTDGTFAKCWIREDGTIKLLKRGSSGARNAGLEPYSEFYSSQISMALDLSSVTYRLRKVNQRLCSVCDIFTSEEYGFVPYAKINGGGTAGLADVLQYYDELGLGQQARDMFVFDALILNEDRHMGNFGVMVDNQSYRVEGIAPLFDHNVSLLCYAEEQDFVAIDKYLSEKGPRIGSDFVAVAKACLTSSMRKKLINLKGFSFKPDSKYNLPDWRLQELSKLVNRQIELILK